MLHDQNALLIIKKPKSVIQAQRKIETPQYKTQPNNEVKLTPSIRPRDDKCKLVSEAYHARFDSTHELVAKL